MFKPYGIDEHEFAKFMHHVENKNLSTTLMTFFDDVKNDFSLNATSKTQKNFKSLFSKRQELKKL